MFKHRLPVSIIASLSLLTAGLFSFHPAFAKVCQDTSVSIGGNPKEICGDNGQDLLLHYIKLIFDWGTGLISALAVLVIIFGGYRYMTSRGNPASIESGKNLIVGAVSGLLLVIFAQVILHAINSSL